MVSTRTANNKKRSLLFISAKLGAVSGVSEVPGAERAAPAGRWALGAALAPCAEPAGRCFLRSKGAGPAAAERGCARSRSRAGCRTGEAAQRRAGRPGPLTCFLHVAGEHSRAPAGSVRSVPPRRNPCGNRRWLRCTG